MKFLQFIDKQKSIISAAIAIVLIIAITVAFYKSYFDTQEEEIIKSYTVGNITEINDTITLNEGQTLVQNYYSDSFDYKQLGFTATPTTESAILNVQISNGEQNQTKSFKHSELSLGYTYIDLDEALKKSSPTDFTVTFIATKGAFDFSANNNVTIENSSCTVDSTNCEKNVVIDLRSVQKTKGFEFVLLSSVIIIFLITLLLFVKLKPFNIEGITAVVALFFCIIFIFVFKPFTVPDEATHYRSAYHVSNMMMLDFSDNEKGLQMRQCDYNYFVNGRIAIRDQSYISENDFDKFFVKDNQKVDTGYRFISDKKALPYVASGLGITVGRILHIGPYWTFQIARLFNAVMAIILIYFAIKILPYGKIGLAVIALIPINLHILSSCSYDAFTFGSVILMFAYIMKIIYDEQKIGWKRLLLLAAMIFIIVPQKVVYIGVAAIVLIIPKNKFKNEKLHFAFKCGLGMVAIASILFLQMADVSKLTSDTPTASDVAGFSVGYILQNPISIIKMLYNTIIIQGDFYIKSMISFFGWFEFETPWFMAIPYVVIIAFAFMRKKGEPKAMGYPQRLYALLMFGAIFLMIEMLLLIDHTYIGSEIILGVQGRYFIPALPLLMLFVRNNTIVVKESFDKKMLYLTSVLNSGMLIYCAATIL